MQSPPITTAQQLSVLREPGYRHQLVHGALQRMSPPGQWHGAVAMRLGSLLESHVRRHRLGLVFAAETGFLLSRLPDTVLAPDVSFVRAGRLADIAADGYFQGAPDLAVEVTSPHDTARQVRDKELLWLAYGTALVWTVDPKNRTITAHRGPGDVRRLRCDQMLSGGDIVPGFAVRISELFPTPWP